MSNPWIVDPAAPGADRRLDLEWTDPDGIVRPLWIQVRTELSIGENRRMLKSVTALSQPIPKTRGEDVAPEAKLEWTEYSFARMVAYIIDWSLTHDPEPAHRLAPKRTSYETLRQDVFKLIDEALDEHERAVAAEKKAQSGRPRPAAISA